jgi:drug/metabolite transporter (DMT)-like permease
LLAILFGAATLHAGWNLLLKRVADRQLVVWWAFVVSSLLFLPLLLLRPAIPSSVWPLALVSSVLEVGYVVLLMSAYGAADFSVVYPIARGAAPLLLLLWAVLFLGERPSAAGLTGLGIAAAGLALVGLGPRAVAGGVTTPALARGTRRALLVALIISAYSAIDGAAVKHADPAAYSVAVYVLTSLLFAPILIARAGWPAIARAGRAHWGLALTVGIAQCVGYTGVLYVYSRGSVAYAGAIRESSIVLGALAGWLWLGEGFGARRVLGALAAFAGILLIALAG